MQFLPGALSALNGLQQFIVYVISESKTRPGKTDKYPIDHRTGKIANAHDPAIWTDSQTAIASVSALGDQYGVGFVFTKNDPFFFIDIDDCLEPTGWSQLAIDLCTRFSGAAIEISNSGRGLHIIGCGTVPDHSCKNSDLNIEFYTDRRFVALTGFNATGDAGKNCTNSIPDFIQQYFSTSKDSSQIQEWTYEPCDEWNGSIDDTILLNRALKSVSSRSVFGGHASFKDLFDCNIEVLSQAFPDKYRDRAYDESSADAALAQHLAFWTGNNCDRIERLMRQSQLLREKWNRDDYVKRTILSACKQQKQWLFDKKPEELNKFTQVNTAVSCMVSGETFLPISDQIVLFTGCIYIQDEHKVLIPGGILLKPEQFRTTYGGFSFPMDHASQRVKHNAWEAFSESQGFRKPIAASTCFRPEHPPGALIDYDGRLLANIWYPVSTKKISGDVSLFLTHLKKVFPNERDREIFLCYMAACVQYPGIKFKWCPFLQGAEGNGKTFFSKCIAYAIGQKYSHFPNASEITEKFNEWMYKTLFVSVEDIHVAGSPNEIMEALKPMITAEFYAVRAMHTSQIMREICCNFILNSNHKDGIRKSLNDRRFAPFYTGQQSKEDLIRDQMTGDYFPNLWGWAEDKNGFAMINDFLTNYKICDEFNPSFKNPAPITSSTQEAIEHSLGGIEQEILECIEQDQPGFRGGWISSMQFELLLQRLGVNRRIHLNKRRELLQNIGYDWHPHLKDGRVNNKTLPDAGKPRLFVKKNHSSLTLTNATEIAKAYSDAQQLKD